MVQTAPRTKGRDWVVYGLVALTCCGVLASLALGRSVADRTMERWIEGARNDAVLITRTIDRALGQLEHQLRALGILFVASNEVEVHELEIAEAAIRAGGADIRLSALGFAERIGRDDRPATEEALGTALTAPGRPQEAAAAAFEHFPVMLPSGTSAVLALGVDLAGNPALQTAVATAIRHPGTPVMSPAFNLGGRWLTAFVIGVPNAGRDGALVGLADLDDLFGKAMSVVPDGLHPSVDQAAADRDGLEGRSQIVGLPSSTGRSVERFEFPLGHGEAKWRLVWHLTEAYGGGPDRRFAIAVAAGGSVMSIAIGMVILLLIRRNREIGLRVRDRTAELRQALIRAEAANDAKTNFLAVISHELRTPLNAIIGFTEILRPDIRAGRLQPSAAEYLDYIHDSGRHLLTEIDDLLDLAQADVKTLRLVDSVVDPGAVLDDLEELFGPRAEAAGIRVTIRRPPDLPLIRADPRRLRQILTHLGMNALKSVASGGQIHFSADAMAGGGLHFTVEDTGIGMHHEAIVLAMEPFGQTENAYSRSHGGLGIGLPLCSHLAKLHGGAQEISSRVGHGTRVTLKLPPGRVLPSERMAARTPDPEGGGGRGSEPIPFPVKPRAR